MFISLKISTLYSVNKIYNCKDMTVMKSEKDKGIARLKRELNKVNNDLAKKKEKLKSTRSKLRGLKAENNKKKSRP